MLLVRNKKVFRVIENTSLKTIDRGTFKFFNFMRTYLGTGIVNFLDNYNSYSFRIFVMSVISLFIFK